MNRDEPPVERKNKSHSLYCGSSGSSGSVGESAIDPVGSSPGSFPGSSGLSVPVGGLEDHKRPEANIPLTNDSPLTLEDEPPKTGKREMPTPKANSATNSRSTFDFEPELRRIASANGGWVTLEDCQRAGMETGLAEMRLNILVERAGWTKAKTKVGLVTWAPPT